MNALLPGLEDGAIVRLAKQRNRAINSAGQYMTRPRIGVRLRYQRVGTVTLRSGAIAAGDLPFGGYDRTFAQRVAPGQYEAWSIIAETQTQSVVAAAILKVSDEPATTCRLALFDGEDPAEVTEDMAGGLGTDSGTIAIGEPLPTDADTSTDEVGTFYESLCQMESSRVVDHPVGGQIAVWASAFGDGMYTPCWGRDAQGKPSWLAVDFNILGNGIRAPIVRAATVGVSFDRVPETWWQRLLARLPRF